MYKLFTDKTETFKCKLTMEGASLSDSTCRLVVESSNWNLFFAGEIDSEGNVSIPIKKLRSILAENETGRLKLEVIAEEDTIFTPWSDDFQVQSSKRVQVEVAGQQETGKPKVTLVENSVKQKKTTVTAPTPSNSKKVLEDYVLDLIKEFKIRNINKKTLNNTKESYNQVVGAFIKENKQLSGKELNEAIVLATLVITK